MFSGIVLPQEYSLQQWCAHCMETEEQKKNACGSLNIQGELRAPGKPTKSKRNLGCLRMIYGEQKKKQRWDFNVKNITDSTFSTFFLFYINYQMFTGETVSTIFESWVQTF